MYRFDHGERRWHRLGPAPLELRWNEFYSTHVPEWKAHLISTMKRGSFRFDVSTRKLAALDAAEELTRCQSLAYDASAHVVVALAQNKVSKYRRTVVPWVLHVRTLKWEAAAPDGPTPTGQTTGSWATLWYDPAHKAHLLINCVRRDRAQLFHGGVTETWAYRSPAPRAKR